MISNNGDVIDIRVVITRVEELEGALERQRHLLDTTGPGDVRSDIAAIEKIEAELAALNSLLDDCRGKGGDEQWRGDSYPATVRVPKPAH
jgi:hypothetical protein